MNRECGLRRTVPLFAGIPVTALAAAVLVAPAASAATPVLPPRTTSVVERTEVDADGDGATDHIILTESTYDAGGTLLTQQSRDDFDADGAWDLTILTTLIYDDDGRLSLATTTTDGDGDGAVDATEWQELTYDARGLVTSVIITRDDNGDGIVDSTTSSTDTSDKAGRTFRSVIEDDVDGDGVTDWRLTLVDTLDKKGRSIHSESEFFDAATGVTEVSAIETTYGKRNNVLSVTETYTTPDETTVQETRLSYDSRGLLTGYTVTSSPTGETQVHSVTRDRRGHETGYTTTYDHEGDGVIDAVLSGTWTYDSRGRLVADTNSLTLGSVVAPILETVYERDARGRDIRRVQTFDEDGDGTAEHVEEVVSTYDTHDRPLSMVSTVTAGGEVIEIRSTTWVYDAHGRVLSEITETDYLGDGTIDERWVFTSTMS